MTVINFDEVFKREIDEINSRREKQNSLNKLRSNPAAELGKVALVPEGPDPADKDIDGKLLNRPDENSELIGLALSGGGIRSAAFCFGALQALEERQVFERVDYLSTVSGGGYIGTSAVSAMSLKKDSKFPFPSELTARGNLAIRHIRDHSNYLFPSSIADLFRNLSIYLRGLIVNAVTVLAWLLLAAIITILIHPTTHSINHPRFVLLGLEHFKFTLIASIIIGAAFLSWSVERSFRLSKREVESQWTKFAYLALVIFLFVVFFDLQPVILAAMFGFGSWKFAAKFVEWAENVATFLAAYSSIFALFSTFLGKLLKTKADESTYSGWVLKIIIKAAMYLAAAAVPLLLWVAYLHLSYWGICECGEGQRYSQTPQWIVGIAQATFNYLPIFLFDILVWLKRDYPMLLFYVVMFLLFVFFQCLLSPNANSLHRLYRDRLSKAFLFDPTKVLDGHNGLKSLAPWDEAKLSKIDCKSTPYQIINAALNIRGSRYANQRGRDADFFVFTPNYTGSRATGYVSTHRVETEVKDFDLAAAMAISGAAVSSNMGRQTIKELSPTLAILNIRLGFWLPNPRAIAAGRKVARSLFLNQKYFIDEIIGHLDETSDLIYLTDGGHIENLGIYELLRRRCSLVIAIDAEADPQMSFNSFVAMQRHALIDLGVLVSLPWAEIRDATRECSKAVVETGGLARDKAPRGPHVALGEIQYPGDKTPSGVLLYIKSSLSGDENDYIIDYKRRYPLFPHESTADQLFTEEQFEVYRALGFHATRRALSGDDRIALASGLFTLGTKWWHDPLIERARQLLFGKPPASSGS